MNNTEREKAIENFLNKWNEAMRAANEITDFKWEFGVKIASNNALENARVRTINGINESFASNNWWWESSNN